MKQPVVALLLLLNAVRGFTIPDGRPTGNHVAFGARTTTPRRARSMLTMAKKGKSGPPINMRGSVQKNEEIAAMRDAMLANSKAGADGLPVFNLFVRSTKTKIWYPCGSFKGDERTAALAKTWRDGGMMSGISKNQLDAGVSGSLFRDLNKLEDNVTRAYPQLKEARRLKGMEWGFKLSYDGLSEEQSSVQEVVPKEQKGLFDGIKSSLGI